MKTPSLLLIATAAIGAVALPAPQDDHRTEYLDGAQKLNLGDIFRSTEGIGGRVTFTVNDPLTGTSANCDIDINVLEAGPSAYAPCDNDHFGVTNGYYVAQPGSQSLSLIVRHAIDINGKTFHGFESGVVVSALNFSPICSDGGITCTVPFSQIAQGSGNQLYRAPGGWVGEPCTQCG